MRHALYLLVLITLVFGCSSAKSTTAEPNTPPTEKAEKPAPKKAKVDYEKLLGPMMEKPESQEKRRYVCVRTGDFDLTPTREHLLMKTICRWKKGNTMDFKKAKDSLIPRGTGDVFEIPFYDTFISIKEGVDGHAVLRIHYVDSDNEPQTRLLPPQKDGGEYEYSFRDLVPRPVVSEATARMM